MTSTAYTTFFGDAEYTFRLDNPRITELEHKCGAGIGMICQRVFHRQFSQIEITETIRLALIGGGLDPKRAAALVAAYVVNRPFSETHPLAQKILERVYFGAPHEEVK